MKLHLVLVRPEHAGNVGAAARAAANMGTDRLVLIGPACAIDESARQAAAGAQDILRSATIYADWPSFYAREGDGLRIALSRRGGKQRRVGELGATIRDLIRPEHLYLILGPETSGLDNSDLAFVNQVCHLPTAGDFASLNLAQAALLGLFLIRQRFPNENPVRATTGDEPAPVKPLYFPDQLVREWLMAMGFNIQARRSSAYLTLRRLFMQNRPTRHEVQVLESVLQQNIRKLKGVNPPFSGTAD